MDALKTLPAGGLAASRLLDDRWVAVGSSNDPDSHAAGFRAAGESMAGPDPRLLIVFCSPAHDLQRLLAGIRKAAHDTPLIGCTTAGEIATNGPGDASVVVTAIGGAGYSVAPSVGRNASADLHSAGATAAECGNRVAPSEHKVLLLLADGLAGDQQEIVRGAYSMVGAAMPLVGGCAGDDLAMKRTHQLYGSEVLQDAVVGAAISCEAPFGIGVQHGWRRVGSPFLVTEASGNRVLTLDDRPALDVYLERLDAPDDARTDPQAFTRFAMTHPLGLSRRSGDEVRFIAEANFEDRSIGCIAEVPKGVLAWLMEGDDESVLSATDAACTQAVAAIGNRNPLGFLAFDCIARRGVLGDEGIRNEVRRIGLHSAGAPVAGFYTYGEIARTRGVGGFHNQTLVVLAFG